MAECFQQANILKKNTGPSSYEFFVIEENRTSKRGTSVDLEVQLKQLNRCDGVLSYYWSTLLGQQISQHTATSMSRSTLEGTNLVESQHKQDINQLKYKPFDNG